MDYEDMGWLRRLFHKHYWAVGEVLTCEECGYQPACPYHGKKLYMHGWDNDIDCRECQRLAQKNHNDGHTN